MTDNGNLINDSYYRNLRRPDIINEKLKKIPGVIETGLFLEMCDTAYVPAVKSWILNRDKSSAGYLTFRSIMMKIARQRTLAPTTAWFVKSVRLLPGRRPDCQRVKLPFKSTRSAW